MGDCDDDESEACIARQRAQTAFDRANDPATVLALLDVVEAAEEMSDYYKHMSDSHSHKLRTALDRLKEVLR
jgi:hypothetical protein